MVSPTQMSAAGVSLEVNTDTVRLSPEQFMVQRDPKRDVRTYIRADVLSWWRGGQTEACVCAGAGVRAWSGDTGETDWLLESLTLSKRLTLGWMIDPPEVTSCTDPQNFLKIKAPPSPGGSVLLPAGGAMRVEENRVRSDTCFELIPL